MDTPTVTDFWKEWSLTGSAGQGVSGRVSKARGSGKVVTLTPSKHKKGVARLADLDKLEKVRAKAGKTLTEGQQKRQTSLRESTGGWKSTRTSVGARKKSRKKVRTKWRKREGVKAIRSATAKKQRQARAKKKATGAKPKARGGGARTRRAK